MRTPPVFAAGSRWRLAVKGLLVLGLALAILKMIQVWAGVRVTIQYPGLLVISLFFQFASVVAAAIVWRHSLWQISGMALTGRRAMAHIGILLVAKYVPGKVWGMLGRGMALQKTALSSGQIAMATFLEQMAFLVSGCLAMAVGWCLTPWGWLLGMSLLLAWLACPWGLRLLRHLITWMPGRWRTFLSSGAEGHHSLCSRSFLTLCVMSLGEWIVYASVLFCIVLSLGIEPTFSLAGVIGAAVPAGQLSGMIVIFLPGGIGVREGVLVYYLQPVMGMEFAVTAAIMLRMTDTLRDVVVGIGSMRELESEEG